MLTLEVTVLEQLKNFISPLTRDEKTQLEDNIIREGCKEPIVVWPHNGKQIIVDGHNRFDICTRHKIEFTTREIDFSSEEEARIWMINNQLGRRNLNADQLSYYRGVKYLMLKNKRGGYTNIENKGVKKSTTVEVLSKEFNVSESTIKRDAKFASGINVIGRTNAKLQADLLSGIARLKKSDIQFLAELDEDKKSSIRIKNEADLYNKIVQLKKESLTDIEDQLEAIEQKSEEQFGGDFNDTDPIFLDIDDRLKKIKGRIISAINQAIQRRDVSAIAELKDLIGKLEGELLSESK